MRHDAVHLDVLVAAVALMLALGGCEREKRTFQPDDPFSDHVDFAKYEKNALNLAEGKRLFSFYNCHGCHGTGGGGGMGPALSDRPWLYGHEPPDLYTTITYGRPNGMPAWGPKTPAYQRWQLVAYVRSLNGWVRKDAAPNRSDHMSAGQPEATRQAERPVVDADVEFWEKPR